MFLLFLIKDKYYFIIYLKFIIENKIRLNLEFYIILYE